MSYLSYLAGTPFFWVTAAGLFLGASVSRISRPVASFERRWARSRRRLRRSAPVPDRVRARMWTLFFLGLSAAVLCGLAAVFVPGPERILDPRLLWMLFGSALLFFLFFRFKRSFGAPVFLIICTIGAFLAVALSPWTVVRQDSTIMELRAIDATDKSSDLEILVPKGLPAGQSFVHVATPSVRISADVVTLAPYYFFFGGSVIYGKLQVNGQPVPGSVSGGATSSGAGFVDQMIGLFERIVPSLPGMRLTRAATAEVTPFPLETFSVMLSTDGVLRVTSTPGRTGGTSRLRQFALLTAAGADS